MRISFVHNKSFLKNGGRFDASFHLSDGLIVKHNIYNSPYPITTIGKVSSRVFYGNRAKRVYVSNPQNGIPFLTGSDIMQADLSSVKLASQKYTPFIDQLRLDNNWVLISRSGTI